MTEINRRNVLGGSAAVAAVGLAAAACTSTSSPSATGSSVTQNAGNVNDLQIQEESLTITPFNVVKKLPDQAYPADLIRDSLELQNQREKVLRFNDPSKLGWAHLFNSTGSLVLVLPVKGKISSTQSSMTTSTGVYKDPNGYQRGGGNIAVEIPGDDLSFGPNEGGPSGKFFFTPDDVYIFWDGPILYSDAKLKINQGALVLEYVDGSKPSNTAPAARV